DEKKEIERILQELTDRVAEHYHELKNNQRLLTILDSIFARGKLSMMMGAEEPQIDESGVLVLREARHPLLDREKAVPISVSLGEKHTTLIITGPNTGGKTVTLKTAGLLSMMAQSGLHIPASSESRIPVFREVFADIGDEQSIEQSLSTFSSHMKNIVEIVENAGEGCLVLLDELGAGTDPAEGAALAIAVIERLKSRKALVFATTHYTELKKYAISKEGVENASMEFNVDTLSPTYRLMTGIPGKSNAFEISAKLGLASSVIDQAKELLETGDIEFEDVVSALEDDRRKAEDERNTAMMLVVSAKRQKEELDRKEEELRRKKEEILSKAREEARLIVREAKDVTREIQKELKNLSKIESIEERNRVYSESRSKVKGLEDKHRVRVIKQANSRPVDASKLKVGDRVKVLSFDQNGEVLSLPDGKGILSVQMGAIKVQVSTEDLMLIDVKPLRKQKKEKSYGNMYRQKTMSMSTSINVVGKNLDDAVMDVDKYLDDAFMAGLNQVTVIHGRREGILRDGLQKMMRHHKHVKSFHRGSYNEGGDGVTVVEIK
ncbi:MAG: endonuclease MutS2, partial [Anaerovoracaceae bacterium]